MVRKAEFGLLLAVVLLAAFAGANTAQVQGNSGAASN